MQQQEHQQYSTSAHTVKIYKVDWPKCSLFLQQNYINQGVDYCLHSYLEDSTVDIEFMHVKHYTLFINHCFNTIITM